MYFAVGRNRLLNNRNTVPTLGTTYVTSPDTANELLSMSETSDKRNLAEHSPNGKLRQPLKQSVLHKRANSSFSSIKIGHLLLIRNLRQPLKQSVLHKRANSSFSSIKTGDLLLIR
ncbi:hypothetical protein CDAR_545151 [Caerostris darwini]|uniref:ATP-dependent DNA helicase n=1 Tax=Caerostris darwini TaxID=1538125 RepID=A0AAV4TKU3_9ARAC|nr:hypothetical protein CDAR_545151 [Caerostris darwini]